MFSTITGLTPQKPVATPNQMVRNARLNWGFVLGWVCFFPSCFGSRMEPPWPSRKIWFTHFLQPPSCSRMGAAETLLITAWLPPLGRKADEKEVMEAHAGDQPWQCSGAGEGDDPEDEKGLDGYAHCRISPEDWPELSPHGASFKAIISTWSVVCSAGETLPNSEILFNTKVLNFFMLQTILEVWWNLYIPYQNDVFKCIPLKQRTNKVTNYIESCQNIFRNMYVLLIYLFELNNDPVTVLKPAWLWSSDECNSLSRKPKQLPQNRKTSFSHYHGHRSCL